MDPLSVTVHGSMVSLQGELDFATLGDLEEALIALPPAGLVTVDAARLTFIDVGGYRELMRTAETLGDRGCLLVHAPQRTFQTLLALLPVPRNVHPVPCAIRPAA